MALSMFGVCASATDVKDYPDYDEITYTEAVGVLSGIGVLQGDEGGFRPTEGLTRAEAAKIADYLIGLQDNNVAEGTKFNDIKGHWAEEYITIAESVGLVNGNGDGTFDPEGDLTGYQWEKMVLCALGYSAEYENMLGDKWEGGVAILADKVDLLKDLAPTYDATKAITREEAAQIAFNALNSYTVYYKLSGATHTLAKNDVKLGEKVFNLTSSIKFDVFGAPSALVYSNSKTGAEYASFAYEPIASYNNVFGGTKVADIEDDIDDYYSKGPHAPAAIFVDGVKQTTVPTSVGGRGVQVDLYEVKPGEFRVVEINTYVEVFNPNAVVPAEKNSNGTIKAPAYIELGAEKAYLPSDGFNKDDVIVYNVGNEKNLGKDAKVVAVNAEVKAGTAGVAKTVSFNGTLAAALKNDGYVKIDDAAEKTYFDANAEYGIKAADKKLRATETYVYYYDNFENIIFVQDYVPKPVSETGHLYLIDAVSYYNKKKVVDMDDLYHPTHVQEAAAQALVILYTDDSAEVKLVDLALGQDKDGDFYLLDKFGNLDLGGKLEIGEDFRLFPIDSFNDTQNQRNLKGAFVEYYVTEDGEYIIDRCNDPFTPLNTSRGNKNISGAKDVLANTSTKLTYITATFDPASVDMTEVGYDNIADLAAGLEVTAKTANGYAEFVNFQGDEGYLEPVSDKDNTAKVGAALGVELAALDEVYGMYLGTVETNDPDGEVYEFVGSDGEKFTLARQGYGYPTFAELTSKQIGKVYKLSIDSKGKLAHAIEIKQNDTIDGTDIDCGNVTYVTRTNYGYMQIDKASNATYDFAAFFGGKAYDAAADRAVDVTETVPGPDGKTTYVKIYIDMVQNGPAAEPQVVFVEIAKDPCTVGPVEATYDVNSGFITKASKDPVTGVSCLFNDGKTDMGDQNVLALFDGKKFDLYYNDTCDINGDVTRTFTKAVARDASFYIYNTPAESGTTGTLIHVTESGFETVEITPCAVQDVSSWKYCTHGTTYLEMNAGQVAPVTAAEYSAAQASTHFQVVGYHNHDVGACTVPNFVIFTVQP